MESKKSLPRCDASCWRRRWSAPKSLDPEQNPGCERCTGTGCPGFPPSRVRVGWWQSWRPPERSWWTRRTFCPRPPGRWERTFGRKDGSRARSGSGLCRSGQRWWRRRRTRRPRVTYFCLWGGVVLMDRALGCDARSPGLGSHKMQTFFLLSGIRWQERKGTSHDKLHDLAFPTRQKFKV